MPEKRLISTVAVESKCDAPQAASCSKESYLWGTKIKTKNEDGLVKKKMTIYRNDSGRPFRSSWRRGEVLFLQGTLARDLCNSCDAASQLFRSYVNQECEISISLFFVVKSRCDTSIFISRMCVLCHQRLLRRARGEALTRRYGKVATRPRGEFTVIGSHLPRNVSL